ncbi:uncharacterized protein PgNI_04654, partial [Pyricularia grisea]|uniref:Uncharacterized protein n=1 Tax=Pyricularia grisea TaxID=148305 RepID=A0A6P8BD88_PYRGI
QEPVNYGVIDSIAPANRSGICFRPSVHYDYDGMCGYVQQMDMYVPYLTHDGGMIPPSLPRILSPEFPRTHGVPM